MPPSDDLTPVVSLVVIAHDEAVRAPEAIQAILAQDTDVPFEVVVVDDGSTDATVANVVRAAGQDGRLHMIRLPKNEGRGAARAVGVAEARGRLIGFIDADITVPPDWLSRCLAELPGYAAVGGIAVPDGHTAVLSRISHARPRVKPGSLAITAANVLFDGPVLRQYGFDPADRLGEDFRLVARMTAAGERLKRIPNLVVRHAENKPYGRELSWRFENGVDATRHMRSHRLRLSDASWLVWLFSWIIGVGGIAIGATTWLLLGLGVTVAIGFTHAASRFHASPVGPFLLSCFLNVPLTAMYMAGRTLGLIWTERGSSLE